MNEKVSGQVWANFESENIWMLSKIFLLVKRIWRLQKINVSTNIFDQFSHFYSFCMNLKQSLYKKLFWNDVFKENLFQFENNVETKTLEPVLQNFAWKNGSLCAFRWYNADFLIMNTLGAIKVSFITVVFDDRVSPSNI